MENAPAAPAAAVVVVARARGLMGAGPGLEPPFEHQKQRLCWSVTRRGYMDNGEPADGGRMWMK